MSVISCPCRYRDRTCTSCPWFGARVEEIKFPRVESRVFGNVLHDFPTLTGTGLRYDGTRVKKPEQGTQKNTPRVSLVSISGDVLGEGSGVVARGESGGCQRDGQ